MKQRDTPIRPSRRQNSGSMLRRTLLFYPLSAVMMINIAQNMITQSPWKRNRLFPKNPVQKQQLLILPLEQRKKETEAANNCQEARSLPEIRASGIYVRKAEAPGISSLNGSKRRQDKRIKGLNIFTPPRFRPAVFPVRKSSGPSRCFLFGRLCLWMIVRARFFKAWPSAC